MKKKTFKYIYLVYNLILHISRKVELGIRITLIIQKYGNLMTV